MCCQVLYYGLVIVIIVHFNKYMAKKPGIRRNVWRAKSSNDALRILASLIAQFHLKKIASSKKQDVQSDDNGNLNNDQSLS